MRSNKPKLIEVRCTWPWSHTAVNHHSVLVYYCTNGIISAETVSGRPVVLEIAFLAVNDTITTFIPEPRWRKEVLRKRLRNVLPVLDKYKITREISNDNRNAICTCLVIRQQYSAHTCPTYIEYASLVLYPVHRYAKILLCRIGPSLWLPE